MPIRLLHCGEVRAGANAALEIAELAFQKLELAQPARALSDCALADLACPGDRLTAIIVESDSDGGGMVADKLGGEC